MIRGSAVYRAISDHLGSVRVLVNINDPSNVPVRLDYEALGSVSGMGVGVIPQGFAGGLYDAETGLVRFGVRDYEPVVGRWVTKDPIRFDGGVNVFAYADNDPLNRRDSNGKNVVLITTGVALGCGSVALGAGLSYPHDSYRRHCYMSCTVTRVCGAGIAMGLGEGFEALTLYSDDWREDREANAAGIDAGLAGEDCSQACENPKPCPVPGAEQPDQDEWW